MLSKLKDNISGKRTDELASELSSVKDVIAENNSEIKSIKSDIAMIAATIKLLAEQQQHLQKDNTESLKTADELKTSLIDSINSVKVMSSSIQNNLVRRITDEMNLLMQEISNKFSGTERLKKEVEDAAVNVRNELKSLTDEVKKLKTVSENIKAQDFELVKTSNLLKQDDSEKLKLMREIDSLQRLVSALRRKTH